MDLVDATPPTADASLLRRLCEGRGHESVLVLAAHPDDETIGAGSRLTRWPDVRVVHVTDGAPREASARPSGPSSREDYAAARRAEVRQALAAAGASHAALVDLGLIDLEASVDLAELARRVADVVAAAGAEIVVTHAYEGGHPDHDGAAFASHAARALLRRRGADVPDLVEMALYHRGPDGWRVHEFLPASSPCVTVELTEEERARKRDAIACFRTQPWLADRFRAEVERFRSAPAYRFDAPPHEGAPLYHDFGWAGTAEAWCGRARAALTELGLGGPL